MNHILKRVIIFVALGLVAGGAFFGIRWGSDLFTNKGDDGFGDEVRVQRGFVPFEQWGDREISGYKISKEDFIVRDETISFTEIEFTQSGDIIVEGTGRLIFTNSILEMSPGENDPRANIFVRDEGEIIFNGSTLKPHSDDPANLYVNLSENARFVFRDSQGLHMLIAKDNAHIDMEDSIWAISLPNFRGGGVQVRDATQTSIKNSTIGGLILEFPEDALADIKGFRAGKFEKFNLKENFSARNVDFNVVLENSEILQDYYEGGNERGLAIFAPSKIKKLAILDSTLNKLVITSEGEDFNFSNLKLGTAQNFSYRNIVLTDSKIMAQWGFFIHGGRATFKDSRGLWFFIYDNAELVLKNSEMNEFDPRNFTGVIDFENVIWKNAGEIIGNNDFIWHGSWFAQGFDSENFRPIVWDDSMVRREFSLDALSLEPESIFVSAARVELFDKDDKLLYSTYTNKEGHASFTILFDDANYKEKFYIKVAKFGMEMKHEVGFLTPTPIKLILK